MARPPRPDDRHRPALPDPHGGHPHGPGSGTGLAARGRHRGAVVRQLDRRRQPGHHQVDRDRQLRQRVHHLPAVQAGPPAQPHLAGVPVRGPHRARDLLAVLLDRELRGTRFYQSALFLPVAGRWPWSGSSGSSSTRATRGCSTPCSAPRSTGTGTLAGTCGRCRSPPAGSTPATSCCSTWPAEGGRPQFAGGGRRRRGPASARTFFSVVFPADASHQHHHHRGSR